MSHYKVIDGTIIVEGRFKVAAVCPTLEAAEDWIEEIDKFEPQKVYDGGYTIDGPCPDPGETIINEGGDEIKG
jgi:hypothetical protein